MIDATNFDIIEQHFLKHKKVVDIQVTPKKQKLTLELCGGGYIIFENKGSFRIKVWDGVSYYKGYNGVVDKENVVVIEPYVQSWQDKLEITDIQDDYFVLAGLIAVSIP